MPEIRRTGCHQNAISVVLVHVRVLLGMMATIYSMARGETNERAFGIEALIASGSAVVTLNERISAFYSEHRQGLYRYLLLSGVTPADGTCAVRIKSA